MFLVKLVLVLKVVLFAPSGPEEGAPTSFPSSQEQESVTMATASLSQRRRGNGGGGRAGVAGAPDLDLDLVEEAEEERRKMRWRREEEEEMKNQAVREGRRRSFPRDSPQPEEALRGRSHTMSHATHHGSSKAPPQAAFSFLMPMSDDGPPSDSQSPANFIEFSQSAASMAPLEQSDWRREPGSGRDLWLKPSPQRLTQVLIGCRCSGRDLADGLSL